MLRAEVDTTTTTAALRPARASAPLGAGGVGATAGLFITEGIVVVVMFLMGAALGA